MSSTISNLVAAQLSQAAYANYYVLVNGATQYINAGGQTVQLPSGWTIDLTNSAISTTMGVNQFITFVNSSTKQVVMAFKGTDNVPNGISDIYNNGSAAWNTISGAAADALTGIQAEYPGFTVVTDGHSLGGGMAQTFALENNLNGYGQNSLPISITSVSTLLLAHDITLAQAVTAYEAQFTFTEVNTVGDPATIYYSIGSNIAGSAYLYTPSTTTSLSGGGYFVIGEVTGLAIGAIGGVALLGYSAYVAHSINTVVSLLSSGGVTAPQISLTTAQAALAVVDASTISSVTVNPDGSSTITETNGTTYNIATTTNAAPPTSLTSLASGETYVFDPGTTNTAYTITGIAGVSASAIAYDPNDSGTLTFTTDTTPGLTLSDGAVLSIPGGGDTQLVDVTGGTATPEQTLLDYLAQIGDPMTMAQLDADNYNSLNPTTEQTAYLEKTDFGPVSGTAYGAASGSDLVLYEYAGGGASPNITGQTTEKVSGVTYPVYNELAVDGIDFANATLINIQKFFFFYSNSSTTLTLAQFNEVSTIAGVSSDTVRAATSGTFDLTKMSASDISLTATDLSGTTLIGNNQNNETLTASAIGNDTLQAGNGTGDTLVAGGGNDTLIGGTGGVTFIAGTGNASMQGNGGVNTYEITNATGGTTTINNYHTDSAQSVIKFENNASSQVVATQSGNDLVLTVGSDPVIVQNYFAGSDYQVASISFTDGVSWTPQNIPLSAICYLSGTHILISTGEALVEDLKIGDLVVTRFSGMQPIKWIGRQSYDSRFIRHNRDHIPVCIRAGALADHMPARDLSISPGHSMLVGGQLVLARSLVNGITITQDNCPDEIHYFQLELESHDCVIAEGAWSETFADGPGLREQFHNAAEFAELYPDQPMASELSLCAPRPEHGPKLDAALRSVVARTAASLTPGPLKGYIDRIEAPWAIVGWAQDTDHPELPVLLEVLLGDRVIATTLACDHRQDLQDAGIGRGRNAFFLTSSIRLRPEMLPTMRVRRVSDGTEIEMTHECRASIQAMQRRQEAPGLRRVA